MPKPSPVSCRRIDRLRQLAYDCGLTDDEARKFGKLTATKTWEALLTSHGLEFESKPEISPSSVAPANPVQVSPSNFLEWVDFGQLVAFTMASAGLSVLVLSLWQQINPLNLLPPIRINIQIGISK
jgi:hypothetical protein